MKGDSRPAASSPGAGARTAAALASPTPPAGPAPRLGAAPPNVDVFWIVGRGSRWMVAYDWSGHAAGVLDRVASSASPDGQRLYSNGDFFDAQGDFLERAMLPSDTFSWATASDGVCGYDSGLWVFNLAEGRVRRVGPLADPEGVVAACSFERDLALVTTGSVDRPRTLWWIRLHDGAVLASRGYPPDDLGDIVVSHDFRYFAENFYSLNRPVTYGVPPSVIRLVAGGAEVGERPDLVTAFSADSAEVATIVFGGGVVGVFKLGAGGGLPTWKAAAGTTPDLYASPTGAKFVGERLDPRSGALSLLIVGGGGATTAVQPPPFDSLLQPG